MRAIREEENNEPAEVVLQKIDPSDVQLPEDPEQIIDVIAGEVESAERIGRMCYWRIGKLISEAQKDEGKYGKKVVERAAEACNKSPRILWDALAFYKEYPKFNTVKEMLVDWSAARKLLTVKDRTVRERLRKKAEKNNMSFREVQELVKKEKKKTAAGSNRDRERAAPRQTKPVALFKKLDKLLDEVSAEVRSIMVDRFEQYQVMDDADRISNEEYDRTVEVIDSVVKKASKAAKLFEEVAKVREELEEVVTAEPEDK